MEAAERIYEEVGPIGPPDRARPDAVRPCTRTITSLPAVAKIALKTPMRIEVVGISCAGTLGHIRHHKGSGIVGIAIGGRYRCPGVLPLIASENILLRVG